MMGIRNSICDVSDQAFKGEIDREREERDILLVIPCVSHSFKYLAIRFHAIILDWSLL